MNTLSEIENITKRVSSSFWKNFINRKPLLLQCLTDIQAALKKNYSSTTELQMRSKQEYKKPE